MEFKKASLETFVGRGVSGLENKGNTCFMNAVLQAMSNTNVLTLYILSDRFYEDRNVTKKEVKLLREYVKMIKALWESNCVVDPGMFKITLGSFKDCYLGFNQQDANEFYMRLVELLHDSCSFHAKIRPRGDVKTEIDKLQVESIEEFSSHYKKSYSYVVDCFAGQYFGVTECGTCHHVAKRFDPFFNMTLEIPDKALNLGDCLKRHIKAEVLDGDEKWYCEGECKSKQVAYKRVTIWKSPVCLVICLKRFAFNARGAHKIDKLVDFPLEGLDLYEYIKAGNDAHKSVYDLYAVVNHTGGPMGGHYFSFCKNRNGKWFNFNDSHVSQMSDNGVVTPMAYMLFYKKRDVYPKMLTA